MSKTPEYRVEKLDDSKETLTVQINVYANQGWIVAACDFVNCAGITYATILFVKSKWGRC